MKGQGIINACQRPYLYIAIPSGNGAAIKEMSLAIFTKLAQAEACVHGTDVEEIHFHIAVNEASQMALNQGIFVNPALQVPEHALGIR